MVLYEDERVEENVQTRFVSVNGQYCQDRDSLRFPPPNLSGGVFTGVTTGGVSRVGVWTSVNRRHSWRNRSPSVSSRSFISVTYYPYLKGLVRTSPLPSLPHQSPIVPGLCLSLVHCLSTSLDRVGLGRRGVGTTGSTEGPVGPGVTSANTHGLGVVGVYGRRPTPGAGPIKRRDDRPELVSVGHDSDGQDDVGGPPGLSWFSPIQSGVTPVPHTCASLRTTRTSRSVQTRPTERVSGWSNAPAPPAGTTRVLTTSRTFGYTSTRPALLNRFRQWCFSPRRSLRWFLKTPPPSPVVLVFSPYLLIPYGSWWGVSGD